MIENFFFSDHDHIIYLMGQENTFSDHFFSEEALSEEQLIKKCGKTEEELSEKKCSEKYIVSDTKASPRRMDAKVLICLQTETSCRLETGMDDCVAAVAASVAACQHRKLRIKNIKQLALVLGLLDEEDAIVSREQICSFSNVRRAAVYVLGTYY